MIRRLHRTPAVHFAAGGALLFAVVAWRGGPEAGTDRPRLEVPASRLAEADDAFRAAHGRAPDPAEEAALAATLVDEEVLFQHALALGLAAQAPVERRLAQIASFVGETDPEEALELGLHQDDVVVRRILVDGARRLVRAAVLAREPAEAALAEHLRRYPERFGKEEEVRLAYQLPGKAPRELPLLVGRDLERRFGRELTEALDAGRVDEWQGPLPSRLGPIRVLVREHRPARTATLDEVRDDLREEVRQELADQWLAARVAQLREDYEVVIADAAPVAQGGAS